MAACVAGSLAVRCPPIGTSTTVDTVPSAPSTGRPVVPAHLMRRRLAALLAAIAVAVTTWAPSAAAHDGGDASTQVDDADEFIEGDEGFEGTAPDEFVLEGVGPGDCHPAVASIGTPVECRFPLIGRVQRLAEWQGPITVDLRPGFAPVASERRPCVFEGATLRCSHLIDFFEDGEVAVVLELGGVERELGAFTAVDSFDQPYFSSTVGRTEPVAWPGRPVRVTTWRNDLESDDGLWALTERRVDGPERFVDPFVFVGSQELDVPEPGSFESTDSDVVAPAEPGRYVMSMCVGPGPDECSVIPGHHPFQVIDPTLHEVVPGHNRSDGDRINLVFVGAGLPEGIEVETVTRRLLGLDGPEVSTFDRPGVPIDDVDPDSDLAFGALTFGPFAVEPLRSAVDRFNFWTLEDELVDERALFHDAHPEWSSGRDLEGFDLDHVSVVALHHQVVGRFGRSEAFWPSFTGQIDTPARADLEFAGVYLAIDANWPELTARTLTHEFGHSLFDLRDEYTETGRSVTYGYPNCADGLEQAEEWWGDLVGQQDPFLEEYLAVLERMDQWIPEDLTEQLVVAELGSVTGGCYDGDGSTIRPSADSVMNSEVPVFGAVNRRRVEQVLDRFDPRVQLAGVQDVTLRCFPAASVSVGDPVRCSGAMARFVDPGPDPIVVSVGDEQVECEIDEIGSDGIRGVRCPDLTVAGEAPWPVTVGVGDGPVREITRLWPVREQSEPPASTTTTTEATTTTTVVTTEPEPTSTITGDGSVSPGVAAVAGAFALAVVLLGGWWFQRASAKADEQSSD